MADKNGGLSEELMEQNSGGEGFSAAAVPILESITANKKGKNRKKGDKADIDSLVTQAINNAFQTHQQDLFRVRATKRVQEAFF